jgi:5'-nucleotidase
MSSLYKGEQMLKVMNYLPITVACFGNHDFDHGLDVLQDLISRSNANWIMSNIKIDNAPIAGSETHTTIWNGTKIGFIGLGEHDWFVTLKKFYCPNAEYEDFVDCSRRLIPTLIADGC